MKWRQDAKTGKLIPIDATAIAQSGAYIQGDVQSFISPVDGSIITDRKQLREHNKRNNVVNFAETEGVKPPQAKDDSFAKKQALYEAITRAERGS
jgi:hypothetical protein